ncbi:MAG TPA: hypothetical protein VFI92_04420 [Steroidobacteraceae bacterium]|nr:hypothetical protein [Steroidobacteraceae bacterium]
MVTCERIGFALLIVSAALPAAVAAPASRCAGLVEREHYTQRVFLGYVCRDGECAGHKAGFAWADRAGITDGSACLDAEEPAFLEGCRAFAEHSVTAEQSGFEWARDNGLTDDCQCGGAGPRFQAGCEAYVMGTGG